jgi:pre-mRNA-processing factor SLU7
VKVVQKNLRIREDTAKYLRNLNPDSAPYDPKSRSMKENPNPEKAEQDQNFKGDNFVKMSGDYVNLIQSEGFMLQANQVGQSKLNTVGMPSQFAMMQKDFKKKKEILQNAQMTKMQEKYGNQEEHLNVPAEIQE